MIKTKSHTSFFLSFSYQTASAQDNETSKTLVFENSLDKVLKQIEQAYSVRIFYKSEDLPNELVKIVLSDSSIVYGINEGLKQFGLKIIEYNAQILVIGKKNFMEEVVTSDFYERIAVSGKVLRGMSQADNKELIVVVDLNRPAILETIKESSSGVIATFGVLDQVIFEGIYGKFNPSGKLPFEIPSSMEAVYNQKEDLPDDSLNPTYEFGYGISY